MKAAEIRNQRQRLRLRLTGRLFRLMAVLAAVLLLLRLDRGAAVIVPGALLVALVAFGARVRSFRRRGQDHYMRTLGFSLVAAELWWALSWDRGGLPPALALLTVNGLIFYLSWSRTLGWWLFAAGEAAIWLSVRSHPGLDAFERQAAVEMGLAAAGLQATAWAYLRVQQRLWDAGRSALLGLKAEEQARAKLVGAMLDNLELPLQWARLEPDGLADQAAALRQGLEEARRLRATLADPPEAAAMPASARLLLVPLLGVGFAITAAVALRDIAIRAPRAWIAQALCVVLGLLLLLLRLRPRLWHPVATATLLSASAAILTGAALAPPGTLAPGFNFASLTIAFAALWLGLRPAMAFTALMDLALAWCALGRGVPLSPAGATLATNFAALWLLLAYFLAPATRAQEEMVRSLEEQGRQLSVQLRVRRRLLGTLFHDAANHVGTLNALAALQKAGAAEPGDIERFRRIHGRLAALVAGARQWLFNDEPFGEESLAAVDAAGLGRSMEELFREPVRAKGLALAIDIPAGLALRAVPELLGEAVLGNLLSNAIKYTPRGRRISLRAWRLDGQACLAVQDQGPGFSAAQLAAFRRRRALGSEPGSEGEAGQGLGLSLAREHVERMGGRLELADAPGGGAEARVWMRAAP